MSFMVGVIFVKLGLVPKRIEGTYLKVMLFLGLFLALEMAWLNRNKPPFVKDNYAERTRTILNQIEHPYYREKALKEFEAQQKARD